MSYFFFGLLLASCADSVPSGVIPKKKMQDILWDMIQADQYSAVYLLKDSARIDVRAETIKRYEQVFQLHRVSKDEFDKSIQYYFSRPDYTKPLFDSLSVMGNRKRNEFYNHRPK